MITSIVIIGLIFLILAHEFGHFVFARLFRVRVEEFGIGYPPRIWGKKRGDVFWSINALPFGGFVKILGEDGGMNDPHSFSCQPIWKRIVILSAGVLMNIFVAWIFFSGVYMAGSPERTVVMDVKTGTPAAVAGLKQGDIILSVNSEQELVNKPKADEFTGIMKRSAGKSVTVGISRMGKTEKVVVVPRVNPPEGEGALGVSITNTGFERQSFFAALGSGFMTTMVVIKEIVLGLIHFFGSIFSPGAFDSVSGPVGVVRIASGVGALGLSYVFQIIGLISVNLAILNIIPFPALDGGRILFLIIEKLRGKPVHPRIEQITNMIGFFALILLMIIVTTKDISKLFG